MKFIEIDLHNIDLNTDPQVSGIYNAFKTAYEQDNIIVLKNFYLSSNNVYYSCYVTNFSFQTSTNQFVFRLIDFEDYKTMLVTNNDIIVEL